MAEDRKEVFAEYFESCYRHGNILNKEQFDRACEDFEREYGAYIPDDKGAVILDYGCGIGDFLYYLKKKEYQNFYGIDISPQQADYCREHITDQVACTDGLDFLKKKESAYDLIMAHDVMEHIPKEDLLKFLGLVEKALKDGGRLIARMPNMSNPFSIDIRYGDFTHEMGFTSKSLHQCLWIAGFREIMILPPKTIPVKNYRNFVRKHLVRFLHTFMRFCFYIQDYTVPQNLDKTLVVIAHKRKPQ